MTPALLSFVLLATSVPYELTTLEERTVRGELVELTEEMVTLGNQDGEQEFAVAELLSLAPVKSVESETEPGEVLVEFADGSLVHAKSFIVKSGRASIDLHGGESIDAPARAVRSVQFLTQSKEEREMWGEIIDSNPQGDAVVVRKGGEGKPVSLDFLVGALRDVSDATVQFDFEGDLIPVNRSKVQVAALIYYQRDTAQNSDAVCRIDTAAGNRWMTSRAQLVDQELTFPSVGGIQRKLPINAVRNFDFSLGKIAFLSDLEPVKKTWRPYLGSSSVSESTRMLFDLRKDQNFRGERIELGERLFRKGLAVTSRTEVSYRLPGDFSRFQAVVGIDPSQKKRGHVRLEIRGDNRVLYDEPIAGDAAPTQLELDVTGVGRLTVLVDFGEGWDIGDQLLLGGARVIR